MVVDVVEEIAVLPETAAVADAVGAADVDRLSHRLGAVGLARVDRAVDVVVPHELEGLLVVLGRVVRLGARQIEAHHAAPLVGHGELGHLVARLRRDVPDAAEDHARFDAVRLAGPAQAVQHRLDDGGELETVLRVQHRRVPHLHVADVLEVGVLGELKGDALESVLLLHDLQGELEALEIVDQGAEVAPCADGGAHVLGGLEPEVQPLGAGEVHDRLRTQRAIQVHMEIGLRELVEDLEGDGLRGFGGAKMVILRYHRYKLAQGSPLSLRRSLAPPRASLRLLAPPCASSRLLAPRPRPKSAAGRPGPASPL